MKIRLTLIATAIALTALSASAANAAVFIEDFNSPAFAGATIIPGNGDSATSDYWGNTDYTYINNGTNGWSFTGSTYYAEQADAGFTPTGNGALLLNEPDAVASHEISGLTVGKAYDLSFLVWGDNRPTQPYSLSYSIGSTSSTYSSADGYPGTVTPSNQGFEFIADSTSETLTFTQLNTVFNGNQSQGSGIIDNVQITAVPEPATWAMLLFGFGGIGFMLRNNSRRKGALALA